LAVACELLHHFELAKQNMSLSAEELDLIKFLVTLLSFSLKMGEACEVVIADLHALSLVACENVESDIVSSSTTPTVIVDMSVAVIAESYALSLVACEVVELQSDIVSSSATPTVVVDVSVAVIESLSPLEEVMELLAVGVMMPFAAKTPDITPLEMAPNGALLCSLQNAQLVVKSHGGTLKHLVPRRRLPSKVDSLRHLARPRPCSLHSGRCLFAPPPSGRAGLLRLAWCKEVKVPRGRLRCRE
jgi:hypothetical protein